MVAALPGPMYILLPPFSSFSSFSPSFPSPPLPFFFGPHAPILSFSSFLQPTQPPFTQPSPILSSLASLLVLRSLSSLLSQPTFTVIGSFRVAIFFSLFKSFCNCSFLSFRFLHFSTFLPHNYRLCLNICAPTLATVAYPLFSSSFHTYSFKHASFYLLNTLTLTSSSPHAQHTIRTSLHHYSSAFFLHTHTSTPVPTCGAHNHITLHFTRSPLKGFSPTIFVIGPHSPYSHPYSFCLQYPSTSLSSFHPLLPLLPLLSVSPILLKSPPTPEFPFKYHYLHISPVLCSLVVRVYTFSLSQNKLLRKAVRFRQGLESIAEYCFPEAYETKAIVTNVGK